MYRTAYALSGPIVRYKGMAVKANDLRRDGWLAALAAVALFATTFLPFLDTGTVRTSFEVVEDSEKLGLLEGWGGASMASLWYGIPILACGVVLLQMLGRWAIAGLVAMLLGTIAVLGSVVALKSAYEPLTGSFLTLVCGALVIFLGARVDLFRSDVTRIQPW